MKRKTNGTDKNKLQREHKVYNKEMREMGMHFLQKNFDEYVAYKYGKYKPKKRNLPAPKEEPIYRREESVVPSMNSLANPQKIKDEQKPKLRLIKGNGNKTEPRNPELKVYTGDLIIGIGTMHKSNSVPVINSNVARDLSTMRR